MSDTFQLPSTPQDIPAALLERFNSGDPQAMMDLYDDGAVFVTASGDPVSTAAGICAELTGFLGLGLPMTATARHIYVADDIAMVILDWQLDGPGPDGKPLHIEGSAADIARRGADGRWRYIIDNPYGTKVR